MASDAAAEHTRIVHGFENTIRAIEQAIQKTKGRWYVCVDALSPDVSANELKNAHLDARDRGVSMRYITEITKDNLEFCREVIKDTNTEIRHFAGIKGSFGIGDEEYVIAIRENDSENFSHCIYSNIKPLVQHQLSIFQVFWHHSLPFEIRLREIEEGITTSVLEIIQNPRESLRRAITTVSRAKMEVLIVFSTANAVRRLLPTDGFKMIGKALDHNTKVRILVPGDGQIYETLKMITSLIPQTEIKVMDARLKTKLSIVIVDRKDSFIFETTDDDIQEVSVAIGQSIYSGSDATGQFFASIFQSLWNQSELYERLKEVDAMKEEFINVAAHELRTPVLPIMLSAESLAERLTEDESVQVILRNATRLTRLANNILDASKLESKTLNLQRQKTSIVRIAEEAIADARLKIPHERSLGIRLKSALSPDSENLSVDRARIRQVLENLLDNAVHSTDTGKITISLEPEKDAQDHIRVSVIDSGKGIDPSVKDKLFGKFVSTKAKGTGLGLYLCKGIVEAHGGRMWAENNADGKGATFAFTLLR